MREFETPSFTGWRLLKRRIVLFASLVVCGANLSAQQPSPAPAEATEATTESGKSVSDAGTSNSVESIRAGEEIRLTLDSGTARARIYSAEKQPLKGGLVVLLAPNAIENTSGIVASLRTRLPRAGWTVLVINGQSVGKQGIETLDDDYMSVRVKAAIEYLNNAGVIDIFVAAEGLSTQPVWSALESQQLPARGFVALGDWQISKVSNQPPILDIVYATDLRSGALAKRRKLKRDFNHRATYEIYPIDAPANRYAGFESQIAGRIAGWMRRVGSP